jgi:shikimate kinase
MNKFISLMHRIIGVHRVLIVGPSGAGKTYITTHIRKVHHQYAIDADTLKQMCSWVDQDGNLSQFENSAGKQWLKTHHFVWNTSYLRNYLKKHKVIYLFGLSKNVFDTAFLFDKVYYLHVDPEIINAHLQSKSRKNPWGKHKKQRELTIHSLNNLLKNAKKVNAILIDIDTTQMTPDDIFSEIH